MTVHALHIAFGILERVCQHRVLCFQVLYLALQVLGANPEFLRAFSWRSDAVRYEALDDLLYTVAVLECVDEGQLCFLCEAVSELGEETKYI